VPLHTSPGRCAGGCPRPPTFSRLSGTERDCTVDCPKYGQSDASKYNGKKINAGSVELISAEWRDGDAHEALLFVTGPMPVHSFAAPSSGLRWVGATVEQFGRTESGALRAGVLEELAVD
jgi:hypothetical protein